MLRFNIFALDQFAWFSHSRLLQMERLRPMILRPTLFPYINFTRNPHVRVRNEESFVWQPEAKKLRRSSHRIANNLMFVAHKQTSITLIAKHGFVVLPLAGFVVSF